MITFVYKFQGDISMPKQVKKIENETRKPVMIALWWGLGAFLITAIFLLSKNNSYISGLCLDFKKSADLRNWCEMVYRAKLVYLPALAFATFISAIKFPKENKYSKFIWILFAIMVYIYVRCVWDIKPICYFHNI